MDEQNDSWARRRIRRFQFAFNGWREILKTEINARFHLVATLVIIGLSWLLDISTADWLWVLSAIVLVWLAELFNTAIEEICDMIQPERDARVKRIKDMCAGAVLLCSVYALLVALLVLLPAIIRWWQL